jgi:predicted alpha/beta-fold hydrolase
LGLCRWQPDKTRRPTMILWHGIEGSASSIYMLAMAQKAYRAGFNVVRMNIRNCGGTEHLTPTLYHGGMSSDLGVVLEQLVRRDGLDRILMVGFSLGGNMLLKLAGEYGESPPRELLACAAISPSVDLKASAQLINTKRNWLYHQSFVIKLKRKIQLKHQLYPDKYELTPLSRIKTIRDFDEAYTSRANGFENADDYYHRASAIRVADQIRVPTLIIHAQDDPFIPFSPLEEESLRENPYLFVLAPKSGGHVAFVSSATNGEDRFWAENRVLEFCQLAVENLSTTS